MKVLGIETSCDECSASVVEDGKQILSNIIASQEEFHKPYYGVVPEIASRKHAEWIVPVVRSALLTASVSLEDIEAIAVTYRPGLIGSLLVGVSFAKGLAITRNIPMVGVDHVLAHIYAPHLEGDIDYPYIGLLVSGGHTLITIVEGFDSIRLLGTTIDDACGEAFDKVARFYDMGYPGGVAIDRLSRRGDPMAFHFPKPRLHKGDHKYDVSYSGLKTACVNQLESFRNKKYEATIENIAASFQKTAIEILLSRLLLACEDSGLRKVVCGGGVSANSYLRERLSKERAMKEHGIEAIFASLKLCTDNAAMVAGLGYKMLMASKSSDLSLNAEARVPIFRKKYP